VVRRGGRTRKGEEEGRGGWEKNEEEVDVRRAGYDCEGDEDDEQKEREGTREGEADGETKENEVQ
jgi:hypothetical protein